MFKCLHFPFVSTLFATIFHYLRPVHSAAVLRARAKDVPWLQHLSFVPLYAATWSLYGCSRTGLLFSPAGTPAWPRCVSFTLHPSLSTDCWLILIYTSITSQFSCCSPSLRISCGLFKGGQTVFNVTERCMDQLPTLAKKTLRYLTSETFALPLILAEMWGHKGVETN